MSLQNRFQIAVPILAAAFYLVACGSSIEDSIDKLGGGPDEQAAARHELILASQDAIEPLIAALESGDDTRVRAELADILVGLMVRSGDERIAAVLEKHLLEDRDPMVRGRIAEELGLHLRSEFFDPFLRAISDPSPLVQAPALFYLSNAMGKLSDEQTQTLRQLAGERALSEDKEVRTAALHLVEEYVFRAAEKAREAALKANLSKADSLFADLVAYAPNSKQARYYQGTFYLDYAERDRGIEILRDHRLLVDVPRLESPPTIDGRLDDEAWEGAAGIDSFYVHTRHIRTTLPPRVETRVLMGYSATALYWGVHCADAHPESLVVLPHEDEGLKPRQDRITFRFDRNRDATTSQIWVNSQGATVDVRSAGRDADFKWDAEATTATYVGDDFWSLECELRWDPIYHPPPASGELSRVNFIRLFRTVEYSQSFAEYDGLEASGILLYQ